MTVLDALVAHARKAAAFNKSDVVAPAAILSRVDELRDRRLDARSDDDGILCLPPVAGEVAGAEHLRDLLRAAYGSAWSAGREQTLLGSVGYSNRSLDDWLPNGFFEQHCDGVRLNFRPFIEADVLRWKPNIKWGNDRGKNPPGAPWGEDRENDKHLTLAEKTAAREK